MCICVYVYMIYFLNTLYELQRVTVRRQEIRRLGRHPLLRLGEGWLVLVVRLIVGIGNVIPPRHQVRDALDLSKRACMCLSDTTRRNAIVMTIAAEEPREKWCRAVAWRIIVFETADPSPRS